MKNMILVIASGALVLAATACSSANKPVDEQAAAPAPAVTDQVVPETQAPAPVVAENDSKAKGLWGASSTGRSR